MASNAAPAPNSPVPAPPVAVVHRPRPWRAFVRKFLHQPVTVAASVVLLAILVAAVVGASHYQLAQTPDYSAVLKPPSAKHLFGTDEFGRDLFQRVLAGAHMSILVGVSSVFVGSIIGTLLGLIAGYYGGWREGLIMRLTDILLAFPGIVLAIGIMAVLGSGMINVIIAVAIFTVPIFVRLVQGTTLAVKELTYIEAARTVGVGDARILFRYVFPNVLPTIVVYFTMRIGSAILISASLGFLGLGVSPSEPEWGAMLTSAQEYIRNAPWTIMAPGLAILITVIAFNLVGDGLRDAVDPKLKL
ncbi:MAG: ABC transporter permease subunit [Alicyclobacillus sp.]|nr:ABC transporter permease subunit [Alicyclobacillus sp.]